MQLRQIHTDRLEEHANKVLSNFNYKFPDEIDIYNICWRYGIKILPLDKPFVSDNVDYKTIKNLKALSIPKNKARRGNIYIKEYLGSIEKKLLLAEEFCHIYLHQANQLLMDKHGVAKLESQAKKMAAYLLMPQEFLSNVYDDAINEAVLISDIADYFVVTEEFAYYRLSLIFNRKVDAMVAMRGRLGTIEWFEGK